MKGTFTIHRDMSTGKTRGGMYVNPSAYPGQCDENGLVITPLGPAPLTVLKGHSFRMLDLFGRPMYLRFPNDGDAGRVAALW